MLSAYARRNASRICEPHNTRAMRTLDASASCTDGRTDGLRTYSPFIDIFRLRNARARIKIRRGLR